MENNNLKQNAWDDLKIVVPPVNAYIYCIVQYEKVLFFKFKFFLSNVFLSNHIKFLVSALILCNML